VVDPILALGVFAVVALVTALVAWPRTGVIAWMRAAARLTERERMEDALKHLHECEYRDLRATVESVAGALEMARAGAVRLVARLEALDLVHSDGALVRLTERGRSEALRILRSHRLWERFLADRTGIAPADWHAEAERREHSLTVSQVEALAASMGHPVYDPHGDPIPTESGKLPAHIGVGVATLRPGQVAAIVHLEDEPREVYEQLLAAGLAVGAKVQLIEAQPERVRLAVDGEEQALAPVVAANVTVAPLPRDEPVPERPVEHLASLRLGEVGVVREIAPGCPGPQRRRLLDLGFVPGTPVAAELGGSPAGPVAYRIRETLIALRRDQAALVRIDRPQDH
jgi:DtxR family Mn-dependent transcriptional regulator